jgi:circadian clock protein KaiC
MNQNTPEDRPAARGLTKSKTGIKGLDEVLQGGLPVGRASLICGSAGCGKTLMACEFLVRGATDYDEPGVFMAFEEKPEELAQNLASLGIDLDALVAQKKIFVDYVKVDRSEIEETGEYDLEGLFIRLASAIEMVGAKRVVLDTIEAIFAGFSDETILRSELRRLFGWLKERGLTAVITGERGAGTLTRHGLEEYVSDCVILLEHRVREGIATRSLRVVKYRGSSHGNNEYPFLIDEDGIWVLPITSIGLKYPVSRSFISSGIPRLDQMFNGKGFYCGSSILVSGTAGTGKTSLAAHLVDEACRNGQRCLYIAFEESADQIIRNMESIGIHLARWVESGLLRFHTARPSIQGAELHLLTIQKITLEYRPEVVVMDPITNLVQIASLSEVKSMLVRIIDFFKMEKVTAMFTSLTEGGETIEKTDVGVSSLMDTWILLTNLESNGERNRTITVLKSRGMSHSNQGREFRLTERGMELLDVYTGQGATLTGSARLNQEAAERDAAEQRRYEISRKQRAFERDRKALLAQIEALRARMETEEDELAQTIAQARQSDQILDNERDIMSRARRADANEETPNEGQGG